MMAIDKKIIAIALVAVIVVAGIATAIVVTNNNSTNKEYTVIDGVGKEIKLSEPVTSLITVNTNAPKAMKILGLDDYVSGISNYTSDMDKDAQLWEMFQPLFKNAKHMSVTKQMTGEEIRELGVKYVLAPTESMTVSADNEKAYAELGITVIRLDCFGDDMDGDFQKLLRICLGDKVTTNDAYEAYMKTSNAVINTVLSKVSPSDDNTFLFYMMTGKGFYNKTSALSEITQKIYGKNALNDIENLDLSGVTNAANTDGLVEQIIALDAKTPIDKLFIRGSSSIVDETTAKSYWDGKYGLYQQNEKYSGLSAIGSSEIYIVSTNILSGPLSYVGYVILAEIIGIDTGYSAAELISDYNKTYGFDEATNALVFGTEDSGATFKEIVYS